jgi:hypothetical protein
METLESTWLSWWLRLVAKRFGYFMAVSLLAWPLLTIVPAFRSILSNVMLLDSYPQLFFFTFINVIAFFFATAILRVLYNRYPSNSWLHKAIGDGSSPWGIARVWGVTMIAVVTPVLLATFFGSEFESPRLAVFERLPVQCSTILCVTLSAVAGVGFLWCLGHFNSLLVGSKKQTKNFFPFEAFDCKGLPVLARLVDSVDENLKPLRLSSTDIQLGLYLVVLAVLHRGLLPLIETDRYVLSSAPSAIVLLLWLLGMVFSGLAHLLDRLRIPVIVSGALILTVIFGLFGSTRPFRSVGSTLSSNAAGALIGSPSAKPRSSLAGDPDLEDLPWKAIKKRMDFLGKDGPDGKGRTLVIVTCPGGGIHAAAWSACVLDKLCDEYKGFEDSLCVISGVSGGSVGTLMFVASRYEEKFLEAKLVKTSVPSNHDLTNMLQAESPALELATRSSLEAISFGATVDDLYGLVGLPGIDRGERLERDLAIRLSEPLQQKTLGDWGAKALDGLVPIFVFNATDAVTGQRVLFDSVPTPIPVWEETRNRKAKPLNYRELLELTSNSFDVLPVTAARISATFPYVSPFTKPGMPSSAGQHVALCDGGYADNEGIVTAVTWVDYLLEKQFKERTDKRKTFDRILLLRIEPALSVQEDQGQKSTDPLSYVRWLVGPLEAMLNVRSTSQMERGNLEADLVETNSTMSEVDNESREKPKNQGVPRGRLSRRKQSGKTPQSVQDVKKQWSMELDEMVKQSKEKSSSSTRLLLPPMAPEGRVEQTDEDQLVVVESIRFRDADQEIPLSWKLSKEQKLWYLLSWKKLDELNPNLRTTMGKYFSPR